jgi:hypothetical protein
MGGLTVYVPVTDEMVAEFRKVADGEIGKGAAARVLGMVEGTFRKKYNQWAAEAGLAASAPKPVGQPSTPSDGLTMDKILKQHHPVERFVSVVAAIPRGEFHADTDMQRLCELPQQAWTRLKRNERVQEYKVRLPDGSFVWGSKQDTALLRRRLMEV